MPRLSMLLPVLCCLIFGVGTSAAPSATVPFVIKEIDGKRPVVAVKINGKPFHMVIHANAGFFMQIHHALAKEVGIRDARHVGAFGIQGKGRLSPLGREEARVDRLSIGRATFADVPVSVFETPGDQDSGMLGLDWISTNHVVVNFADRTAALNPSRATTDLLRSRLLARGYAAVPMQRNPETGRYHVRAVIGRAAREMDVSTVADTNIDEAFARTAGIAAGPGIATYGGPQGATGKVYATGTPVTIMLAEWRSSPIANAVIQDVYAYASKERPATGAIGGQLGADFMIDNAAVIDFGNGVLYLRRP